MVVSCDICHADRRVSYSMTRTIRHSGSRCRSCAAKLRKPNGHGCAWKGCKYFSGTNIGGWRNGARQRGLEWDLSVNELDAMWERQNGRCALSGIPLDDIKQSPNKVSLDRKDSNIGYVVGNVQFVTSAVNFAKQDYSDREFIALCERVVANATKPDLFDFLMTMPKEYA